MNIAPQSVTSSIPAPASLAQANTEGSPASGFQQTLNTSLQAAQNAGQPSQAASAGPANAATAADAQKQASTPASAPTGKSEKSGKSRESEKASSKDAAAQPDAAGQDVTHLFVLAPAPVPAALPVALPVTPQAALPVAGSIAPPVPVASAMDRSTVVAGALEVAGGFSPALAANAVEISALSPLAALTGTAADAAKAGPAGTQAAAPVGLPAAPATPAIRANSEAAAQPLGLQAAKTPEAGTLAGALSGAAGVAPLVSSGPALAAHTLAAQAHIPVVSTLSGAPSAAALQPADGTGQPAAPYLAGADTQTQVAKHVTGSAPVLGPETVSGGGQSSSGGTSGSGSGSGSGDNAASSFAAGTPHAMSGSGSASPADASFQLAAPTPAGPGAGAQSQLQSGLKGSDVSAGAVAAARTPGPPDAPAINTARVLASMSGTEMRVGMHSAEFGSISIATSVTPGGLAAQISLDHGDLGRALAAHLPGMEEKLGSSLGLTAKVEVRDTGAHASGGGNTGFAGGDTASQSSGSQSGASRGGGGYGSASGARQAAEAALSAAPAELTMQASSGARLSVRA